MDFKLFKVLLYAYKLTKFLELDKASRLLIWLEAILKNMRSGILDNACKSLQLFWVVPYRIII